MPLGGQAPRPAALGGAAMVASPHHLASATGLDVLRAGGSAVDACIAMNATLGVVYGHMCGPGGDVFAQVWDPRDGRLTAINGSGRAGEEVTIEAYAARGLVEIPARGVLAANTVPGAVDGWARLHERFGRIAWDRLFAEAIRLADTGAPISEAYREAAVELATELGTAVAGEGVPGGRAPGPGATLRQPDLAASLRLIAGGGPDPFYRGDLAARLVDGLRAAGGLLTRADFAAHRSDWVEPLRTTYRGLEVTELPPNTQGLATLLILNLIETVDVRALGDASPDLIHLFVEATKLAYEDRDRWVTDPDTLEVPYERLLSKDYAAERRALIDPGRAAHPGAPRGGAGEGDTVYLCAVDPDGMACSMIQSLYYELGSGFVAPGTGIVLQNRGCYFRLEPDHPNALAPRKRTFHTLIPAMALRDGRPVLLFGSMGGEGQPQTQATVLTRIVDVGLDVQAAIDAPRWRHGRRWGEARPAVALEGRISEATAAELRRRGHDVERVGPWSSEMGHAQAIAIDRDAGVLSGGADPRSDGSALGW